MQYYGAKGIFTEVQNASGFRLLAVDSSARGQGVGKLLSQACIQKARDMQHDQVIIHSTKAMRVAWSMYEKLGFTRVKDFDFKYSGIDVFGFHLLLYEG